MLRALARERPDRLPVTIHQWQQYHLDHFMGRMDALTAFKATGLDASIQYFAAMGQFWIPDGEHFILQTPEWREEIEVGDSGPENRLLNHTIHTPGGTLTYKTGTNETTTWILEYLIKRHEDVDLIEKYMPVARLDKKDVAAQYDALGDAGILRGKETAVRRGIAPRGEVRPHRDRRRGQQRHGHLAETPPRVLPAVRPPNPPRGP
jgi:uroporphyrinogen decarboxylase